MKKCSNCFSDWKKESNYVCMNALFHEGMLNWRTALVSMRLPKQINNELQHGLR